MKHSFNLDDLESFLSEEVEQVRMYPDDRVWRNIQENLHGKDRWPALTFGSILTGSVIIAIFLFIHPNKDLLTLPDGLAEGKTPSAYMLSKANTAAVVSAMHNKPANELTGETYLPPARQSQGYVDTYAGLSLITNEQSTGSQAENTGIEMELLAENNSAELVRLTVDDQPTQAAGKSLNTPYQTLPARVIPLFESGQTTGIINESPALPETAYADALAANHTNESERQMDKRFKETSLAYPAPQKIINRLNKSRWAISFYATPSSSYRYLIDENRKVLDNSNIPFAPYMSRDVNEFVQQRPKLGLEAGIGLHYLLADNFRIKSGLQVNYRQFGIAAYSGLYEPTMLQLTEGTRMQNIMMYSNLSTDDGSRSVELNNNFFQLAIPLGFEMRIGRMKNVDFFTAAAGQFTYQLSGNNYLITSDFKNFVKQPDLNRRFNINMAVEAFAAVKIGGITLQGGPQIRYQLLPGSKNSYPIREHLVDYGFKIGVLKPLK